ncbi:Alg9-like mannosyltransferase family-domain-containing protein [Epithele typhae]|uniref:Alg9-like mannosyltransferase family-domain-containing protein n=1 Tax=Epithele typhae TaxID=378194 RepID=UPI002007A396|nr:Alg9-like mannosyltransferase family-domain-containing protein [Epithele typhae]KAH9945859.1 Alg9-like mannosyltransferase family-domain-containing protein [Epithele typhae]
MDRRWLLAIAVRVGIALATDTFFQPDEFFQSLEVAHHAVFGYGHLTWEWVASRPIRSIVYPALNVAVYRLLSALDLDSTSALVWAPKVLHGLLAAATDISLLSLARRLAGERYVETAFYLSLSSFFHGLSLSRSLSNSAETALTTVALAQFPWDTARSAWKTDLSWSLLFAGVACAVRPTNAIIWTYMFAFLLWGLRTRLGDVAFVLVRGCFAGAVIAASIFLLDSWFYGEPTFTPLNFLLTNASSVSLFYGSSPWHYYLSQGIPVLCFPIVIWAGDGLSLAARRSSPTPIKVAAGLVAWTISVYSLAGHKEWRFLHPLLPLVHVLAAKSLVDGTPDAGPHPTARRVLGTPYRASMLAVSVGAVAYVALLHGRAQVEVVRYLRTLPAADSASVGFLMPCHSTPWQSHLHRPDLADGGRLWALGCEPPLEGQDVSAYKDQTDVFYDAPLEYLTARFPARVDGGFPPSPLPASKAGEGEVAGAYPWRHEWPQNLVFFGALLEIDGIKALLERLGYAEVWAVERGWEGDGRRTGGVRVWRFRS